MGAELDQENRKIVPGICGICPGGCGVNIELEEGKIAGISPLKGHPVGVVCVRGLHAPEIVYSKDRLKVPLLRTGQRGEGTFQRIGWDEALDRIAQRDRVLIGVLRFLRRFCFSVHHRRSNGFDLRGSQKCRPGPLVGGRTRPQTLRPPG
jgi:anaerobic selenocysteine-containing dehydrogenase